MSKLITTLGPKNADEMGMILPHEHIFVDLRPGNPPGFAQADAADVVALMAPEVDKIKAQGVTALVECTPVGVGRRADLVRAVSEATKLPMLVPTGIYREPWVPAWATKADVPELTDWMLGELQGEIEKSGVQAAWIKLSAGDEGITPTEIRILRAAAVAGRQTNAVIGSHTIRGSVVREQLGIIESAGYSAGRFIWIHTQAESDFQLHLEMARRGCWLEYDAIGWQADEEFIELILRVLDAGFGHQLMLSQDRGWYDPARPNGGQPEPFTYLVDTFLPKLSAAGVDDATIRQLTHLNPVRAFAR